jgi:hypothetical protein
MRKAALIAAILSAAGTAAVAQDSLSITVYNDNLALVQDARRLDVAAGRSKLEFRDVSAAIKPETVALTGKDLSVVEQNFDYDLLTPAKMMEKAVGRQIEVVRVIPGTGREVTEKATVLSVNDGVVLKIGNRIEVLRDDGIPTRVIFSSIPENLRAEPTLSVTVDSASAGSRDATLSYLTTGLSWKADYVSLFDEKQGSLKLQGWITLTNTSGTSFKDAKTQLVAGDIKAEENRQPWERPPESDSSETAGSDASGAGAIGDYKLYTLPERVTIAQAQTKQVGFLDLQGIPAKKIYEYRAGGFGSSETPQHAAVAIDFSNKTRAMPAGTVRVYLRDQAGEPKFAGENGVGHTPAGSQLSVKIGDAFDVTVQPTLVSSEKTLRNHTRYAMSYVIRNAQASPVTVEMRQGGLGRGGDVENESLPSRRIDAGTLGWSVPVPANGETTLTFTVDSGL